MRHYAIEKRVIAIAQQKELLEKTVANVNRNITAILKTIAYVIVSFVM